MSRPVAQLTPAQLEDLRQFTTPTIANAMEIVSSWDRVSGVMDPRIKALFPEMKPIAGYACTSLLTTCQQAQGKLYADWQDYWKYVLTVPGPRVSIGQDIDSAPALGSIWGEVQANIHLALGCVGAVVEGAMRDLSEMQALNFTCFSREVVVSHAYSHFIDFGCPVQVGGVVVHSGDLIHADRHGVMVIPPEVAPLLADACRKIIKAESRLIATCQDRNHFSIDRLAEAFAQFMKDYPVEKPSAL
ncbi:MAG: RraA family protein [Terriglobia bacterium]